LQQVVTTKINQANPAIAQAAVRELVDGLPFELFIQKPSGLRPVGALSKNIKEKFGSVVNAAMLSSDTLIEHRDRNSHIELTTQEYRLLPEIIANGMKYIKGDGSMLVFTRSPRVYRVAIKRTLSGNGLFVMSFSRAKERNIEHADAHFQRLLDED
jgi:hypothetical protein